MKVIIISSDSEDDLNSDDVVTKTQHGDHLNGASDRDHAGPQKLARPGLNGLRDPQACCDTRKVETGQNQGTEIGKMKIFTVKVYISDQNIDIFTQIVANYYHNK